MSLKRNENYNVVAQALGEVETTSGNRFYAEFDETFNTGETKYVLYQMPSAAARKIIALQQRQFKTNGGSAEIQILWDSTGVVTGAEVPSFNENRNSGTVATMKVNNVTSVITEGTVRERDFISGTSAPGQSSGGISPNLGFRLYSPDSFFILKITNTANAAQRIHVAYTWYELPADAVLYK